MVNDTYRSYRPKISKRNLRNLFINSKQLKSLPNQRWRQKPVVSIYTCQLSRIMRESHACMRRLKTSISRTHAPRTISHAWLTNPDELFFNTWLITKIKFNIAKNNSKRRLTLTQHTKMSSLKRSSEHLRKFSATFGSLPKIVGNVQKFRS